MFDRGRLKAALENGKALRFYYSILERELEGCHVIKTPSNNMSDESHLWGLATTHYEKSFYKNAFNTLINSVENI